MITPQLSDESLPIVFIIKYAVVTSKIHIDFEPLNILWNFEVDWNKKKTQMHHLECLLMALKKDS